MRLIFVFTLAISVLSPSLCQAFVKRQLEEISSPEITRVLDLNQDGKLDLVVGDLGNEVLTVFLQGEARAFAKKQVIHLRELDPEAFSMSFELGQFSGSGAIDLFVFNSKKSVLLYRGDGKGNFDKGEILALGPPAGGQLGVKIHEAKSSFDSFVLITKNDFSGNIGVSLLRPSKDAEGTTGFVQVRSLIPLFEDLQRNLLQINELEFDDISSGDFNGDGIPDLVLTSIGGDLAIILAGDPSGNFKYLSAAETLGGPTSPRALDLDGDGADELVVGHYRSVNSRIYKLNGSALTPIQDFTTGNYTSGFELLKRDAGTELVAVNYYSGSLIGYSLGGAEPNFAKPAFIHKIAERGMGLGAYDLDADGLQDLVVNDFQGDKVILLFGDYLF